MADTGDFIDDFGVVEIGEGWAIADFEGCRCNCCSGTVTDTDNEEEDGTDLGIEIDSEGLLKSRNNHFSDLRTISGPRSGVRNRTRISIFPPASLRGFVASKSCFEYYFVNKRVPNLEY